MDQLKIVAVAVLGLLLIISFEFFHKSSSNVQLVGYNDLLARGMNAALAIAGNYVYVGSRTEGETHQNAGVLIVDVSDPSRPKIVGQIKAPDEALLGMTSRELRAVPDKKLLIVLNFSCSTAIHACTRDKNRFPNTGGAAEKDNLKFYNLSDPVNPKLISTYDFGTFPGNTQNPAKPHEFFLWRDPKNSDRILLYFSTPGGPPALKVLDASDPKNITLVASWDAQVDGGLQEKRGDPDGAALHSLSVSDDGKIAYLSYLGAGFFMIDTSEIAEGKPNPKIHLLTPIENRVDYAPPYPPENHSAVKIPNRDIVITTDEVYPKPTADGCPWGWMRLIDIKDVKRPKIVGEYKLPENDEKQCPKDGGPVGITFTSHNPTLTEDLALVTWHAGGLQIIDTTDPAHPKQVGVFYPEPLPKVGVEDPALGGHPIAMWSYPVIKDGLIYLIDIRNGLYILRYTGPYADQVNKLKFLEGNSSLR
ncbi:hypothetical protein HY230_10435 [Candidatus Acetothermia bacterium]|nr:hypothetical protein [Candidatus Acetothermia bacterium]